MTRAPLLWHRVKIARRVWPVWLSCPDLTTALRGRDGGEDAGALCCWDRKIVINVTTPPREWPRLLVHELLHATIWPGALRGEERVVTAVDRELARVLTRAYGLRLPPLPDGWRAFRRWAVRP